MVAATQSRAKHRASMKCLNRCTNKLQFRSRARAPVFPFSRETQERNVSRRKWGREGEGIWSSDVTAPPGLLGRGPSGGTLGVWKPRPLEHPEQLLRPLVVAQRTWLASHARESRGAETR